MLLELYIFMIIVLLIIVAFGFYSKCNPLIWALGIIISGILAVTSFNVEQTIYEYNTRTIAYAVASQSSSYPYFATLFIGLLGMCVIFFWMDIMNVWSGEKSFWRKEK